MIITRLTLFLLPLFVSLHVCAQDYDPEKKYEAGALLEDLNVLSIALREGNTGITEYTSDDSLNYFLNEAKAKITGPMTESEFQIVVRQFLANVKCGHTVAVPSTGYYAYYRKLAQQLPVEVYVLNDRLYVRADLSEDSILVPGMEILSINGHSGTELLNAMRPIQPRDGYADHFIDYTIEKNFRTYYLFLYGATEEYDVLTRDAAGMEKNQLVHGNLKKGVEPAQPIDSSLFNEVLNTYQEHLFIQRDDLETAVLKIDGFQQRKYKKFNKQAFQLLSERDVKNLIIDIRDNGGGYFLNATDLLTYLLDKDFDLVFCREKKKYTMKKYTHWDFFSALTKKSFSIKPDQVNRQGYRTWDFKYKPAKKSHFDGRVYLLTNGGSFSMSGYVAAYLKDSGRATLIGEETGGGLNGSNAILMPVLTLPNSSVRVYIPYYHIDHQVKKDPSGNGVTPDYSVQYTLENYLNHEDPDMQKALELIGR